MNLFDIASCISLQFCKRQVSVNNASYYTPSMQRDTLENELHRLRERLTHSAKEIELLKNEGQRKEREQLTEKQKLQDRLQQLQRVIYTALYVEPKSG